MDEILLVLAVVLGLAGLVQLFRRTPAPAPLAPPAPPEPKIQELKKLDQEKDEKVKQAEEDHSMAVDSLLEKQQTSSPSLKDIKAVVDFLQVVGSEVRDEQAPKAGDGSSPGKEG